MCTVTIFPKGENDFVLTSNRDEAPGRLALVPDFYTFNETEVLLPKDRLSGGSWIGTSSKNRVLCLLNGGFVKHIRKTSYRKSRGVVLSDLLVAENIEYSIKAYNLNGVEPFTLVIVDWNDKLRFYELVWDGSKKYFSKLPPESKIWSSSTLYSEEEKQTREKWFNDFKSENELTKESILEFHKTAGKGNKDFGVIMDRGVVKTTSVTQVEKTNNNVMMRFENMNTSEIDIKTFNLLEAVNE